MTTHILGKRSVQICDAERIESCVEIKEARGVDLLNSATLSHVRTTCTTKKATPRPYASHQCHHVQLRAAVA